MSNIYTSVTCTAHQQRIWFIDRFERGHLYAGGPVYHNIPVLLRLEKKFTEASIRKAAHALVEQLPLLRTTIAEQDGVPVMQVHDEGTPVFDVLSLPANGVQEMTDACMQLQAVPFELQNGFLFRFYLLYDAEGNDYLFLLAHHIVADRQTMKMLAAAWLQLIDDPDAVIEEEIVFTEFANWQNGLTEADWEPFRFYWKRKLGHAQVLYLDTDHPRAAIHVYAYDRRHWQCDHELYRQITAFCEREQLTLFAFFNGLMQVLMYRYSGQEEIVTGVMHANRDESGMPSMFGAAANLLALKMNMDKNASCLSVLKQAAQELEEINAYAAQPFEQVVMALKPENDMSRTALFDIMMHHDRAWTNSNAEWIELNAGLGKYDMNFLFTEAGEHFRVDATFNHLYILPGRMERLLSHLETLAKETLKDASQPVHTISVLPQPEIDRLVSGSAMAVEVPGTTIVHLFEQQANDTPDCIAVVFHDQRITYRQLDERSNRLAHYLLRVKNIQPGELVIVQLERSEWLVTALLAVLKAGACYVPVDPQYPEERREYIRKDSGARVQVDGTLLDDFLTEQHTYSSAAPGISIQPGQPAYIIYTSGSTGDPKGVVVEHRNVVQLFESGRHEYDFNASDAWLLFHSVCFDFSVWEMYGALLFGGRLVIADNETVKDPSRCWQLVRSEQITVLNQTPSAFYHFTNEAQQQQWPAHALRYVIFGGEALQPSRLQQWHEAYPGTKLVNMFGITETTVHVTYKEITGAEIKNGASNIGKPLSTLYTYILDANAQLSATGITGELYVGGGGVAKGYHNRPELTAQRFIPDPFNKNNMLYRTGDKARLTASGDLEYLGRADEQVKIRGYRIEPGEIETLLEKHPRVSKGIVIAVKDAAGDSELIAFVTGCSTNDIESITQHLVGILPGYMVPAQIISVAYIPVTGNGKTDKKALLALRSTGMHQETVYAAPQTETEELLSVHWSAILQKEKAGRNDHFFHSGGHSLKAVQLQLRIRQQWQVDFNVSEIFIQPVLSQLAARIDLLKNGRDKAVVAGIVPLPQQDHYPASPAQKRLWFLEQFQTGAYHVEIAVSVTGALDVQNLQQAVIALVQRHEILRTVFRHENEVRQVILPAVAAEDIFFTAHAGDDEALSSLLAGKISQPFDLENGPLFRVTLFRQDDQKAVVLLELHHIIFDDWSAGILVNELFALYTGAKDLPQLAVQYKEYAAWKEDQKGSDAYRRSAVYWKDRFAELPEPLELPLDFPRPKHKTYNGITLHETLDAATTETIRAVARQYGSTFSTIVLSAFQLFLYRYTGHHDMVTGMPVSDRDHPAFEQQVGLFQNTLALRFSIDPNKTLSAWIGEVSHTVIDALDHHAYPFDELVEQLPLPRDLSRSPLFDVMFTHQHEARFNADAQQNGSLQLEWLSLQPPVSKFDLLLALVEGEYSSQLSLTVNSDLFSRSRAAQMLRHIVKPLQDILHHPSQQIKDTGCLQPGEAELLPYRGRETNGIIPVQQLWLQQWQRRPDAPALAYEENLFTYQEFFNRALTIAARLQDLGCEKGTRIGVYCNSKQAHAEMYAALLLLNASYLPLDMKLPGNRLLFIIEESKPLCVVADEETKNSVTGAPVVLLDELLAGEPMPVPDQFFTGSEESFIIYTSGTTGTPKGMMQTYSTLSNLASWMITDLDAVAGQKFLQFSAVSFDAFVTDTAYAWAAGLAVCYPNENERHDLALLYDFMMKHESTVVSLPFSVLRSFIAVTPREALDMLPWKCIFTYGEQLIVSEKLAQYLAAHPNISLHNYYGPAETHVITAYKHSGTSLAETWQPIGTPVNNTQVYVLDGDGQLAPTGVNGMLYAAGANLFNGYINPSLPDRKTNLPHIENGATLFCTGDLVRWRGDGQLQYIGRRDQQVKINGNRVEIAEIEQAMLQYKGIQQAVVMPAKNDDGTVRLLAFYNGSSHIAPPVVRQYLQSRLPVYMVPAFITAIEEFPVNKNGKIDRPKLLQLEKIETVNEEPGIFSEEQSALKALWEDVLGQSLSSPQNNFFELGGHSLSLSLLLNRVRAAFHKKISIEDLFNHPVFNDMWLMVEQADNAWYDVIPAQPAEGMFDLSPAQTGFWLKIQQDEENMAHHISADFILSEMPLLPLLQEAVQQTVNRHAALRTVFQTIDGQVKQVVLPATETIFVLAGDEDRSFENHYKYNTGVWPLFHMAINKNDSNEIICSLQMHHLVSDGWTLELFVEELLQQYSRLQQNPATSFLPIVKQYPDYSEWMNKQLRQNRFDDSAQYWRHQLAGAAVQNNLRRYRAQENMQHNSGSNIEFSIAVSDALRAFLSQRRMTMYHYVLAIQFLLLNQAGGQNHLLVAGVSAGRVHKDLEQMMGYFLNTYYLGISIDAGETCGSFCNKVKQCAREALQHQLYPFEQVLEFLSEEMLLPTRRSLHETGLTYNKSRYRQPAAAATKPSFTATPFAAQVTQVKDPLWWFFTDDGDTIFADVHFAVSVFEKQAVEELCRRYIHLFHHFQTQADDAPLNVAEAAEPGLQQAASSALQQLEEDF